QGTRYYTALRRAGVQAEMLIFPGEDHELTRTGSPGTAWSASRRSWTGGSGCSPSPAPDRALTGRSHPGGEPLPDAVGAEQPVDLAEHRRPVLAGDQAGRPGRGAGLERLLARAEGA